VSLFSFTQVCFHSHKKTSSVSQHPFGLGQSLTPIQSITD